MGDDINEMLREIGRQNWQREQRRVLWSRIIRWTLAVVLVATAALLLSAQTGFRLLAPFMAVLACVLVSLDIVEFIGNALGDMLWNHREGEVKPLYSIPEAFAAKRDYVRSEQEYEKIIEQYPQDPKPHVAMVEIAVMHLKDLELAQKIYERGMEMLQEEDTRQVLTRMYEAISSRAR